MAVVIKETEFGLELRSTSWYEIDAKAKEYLDKLVKYDRVGTMHLNPRNHKLYRNEYEFIEDHIEMMNDVGAFPGVSRDNEDAISNQIHYVIRLKKSS